MKRTARISLLVAGSLMAMATAASAGNREGAFSVSPVIGGITFDGPQHLESAPVYGIRTGYNFTKALGIEALFDYANTETTKGASSARRDTNIDYYRYGGELLYHFFPDNNFVPYFAAGYAAHTFKGTIPAGEDSVTKGVGDYGLGAKYFLNDKVALRADVRHLIYRQASETQHAVTYSIGLHIPFGGKTEAAPMAQPVAEAAPIAQPVPQAAPTDSDGDGVYDADDACPNTPAGVKVDVKGCPLDSDRDGVYDYLDKCPGTPEGVKVDTDGCPLDSDRDGVYDYLDKCPGTPQGVTVDKVGCPVKLCSPTVLNIKFDTNKADIKPQYRDELKKVGEFLNEFPKARGVIEGHTDSVGRKASNMRLSQRRADSVRAYIIKNFNIAPDRISAKGFGPTRPVADNKTAAGKQQNRRIEANFTCNGK
jgi:OOP family OmpA-OmpF porin